MTKERDTAARLVIHFTTNGFIVLLIGDTTRQEEVCPARPFSFCKERVKTAGNTTVLNVHFKKSVIRDITFIPSITSKEATIAYIV